MMDQSFLRENYLMEKRAQTFGPCGALVNYRFDRDNGQVPQIAQARSYAAHWSKMREENIGLLLWGPPGSGKTFCAACIANALLETEAFPPEIIMTTLGTVLRQLLAGSPQEKEQYMERLLACDLLILDDLGMERQTDYAREQIFSIVDGRLLRHRPVIVTTNLTLQQMKASQTLGERRIYDRLLEVCVPVLLQGESLRGPQGSHRLQRFRSLTALAEPENL